MQAGALTSAFDREVSPNNPDAQDYERAAQLFTELTSNPKFETFLTLTAYRDIA